MKRIRVALTALIVGAFMAATPVQANVVCDTYRFTGDDDSAFNANLPFTLSLGATEYSNVFISTNGTMTFGTPDGNYWDYPQTPSVSVAGYDWVSFGEGAYLSYGSTANTFCAEWSVRPFPQSTGELTQIRLVIDRSDDGRWHGEIVTFGWLPENLRRGIRFEQGQPVVPIAAAFDVNGGVPIEVEPAPVPSSFEEPPVLPSPTPEPVPSVEPEPIPSVEPTLNPEPSPMPEPSQSSSSIPEPIATPTIEPTPEATQSPDSTPTPVPLPEPTDAVAVPEITPEPSPIASDLVPDLEPSPEPTPLVTPDVMPEPVQELVQESSEVVVLEVPSALANVFGVAEIFAAAEAFMNIGSDMTEEEREQSQSVVVAAVIVGQLAMRKTK
jgi:hypothetical protein